MKDWTEAYEAQLLNEAKAKLEAKKLPPSEFKAKWQEQKAAVKKKAAEQHKRLFNSISKEDGAEVTKILTTRCGRHLT